MRHLCEVWNRFDHSVTLVVEPWGADYTLHPGETVLIMVVDDEPLAYPSLGVEPGDSMSLFIEGLTALDPSGASYQVMANGRVVSCGYQRPATGNWGP